MFIYALLARVLMMLYASIPSLETDPVYIYLPEQPILLRQISPDPPRTRRDLQNPFRTYWATIGILTAWIHPDLHSMKIYMGNLGLACSPTQPSGGRRIPIEVVRQCGYTLQ